jgi:nucleotide-binding universal stress UspA family protein
MFKRLLVPLDGSHLAEAALPAAAYLAGKMGSRVIPIHVVEKNAPQEVHGDSHLTTSEQALAYLDGVAARFFPSEMVVEPHVHTNEVSNVSLSIAQHIEEFHPDLIVMCTHGKGGMRNFLFGSIAQQVIGLGKIPVLIIHPTENDTSHSFIVQKIIAPIDGNPDHECGLPVASMLAGIIPAILRLVMVVPTLGTLKGEHAATGRFLPTSTRLLLNLAKEDAQAYLLSKAAQLQVTVKDISTGVSRGDPAAAIATAAKDFGANLIVLSTHGKSGQDAFWSSSVAPKVSDLTHIPLLLVPV